MFLPLLISLCWRFSFQTSSNEEVGKGNNLLPSGLYLSSSVLLVIILLDELDVLVEFLIELLDEVETLLIIELLLDETISSLDILSLILLVELDEDIKFVEHAHIINIVLKNKYFFNFIINFLFINISY